MWLADLLRDIDVVAVRGSPVGRPVAKVTCDSRTVSPGDVFVCIDGTHIDGHEFVGEAAARGAAALVVDAARLDAVAGDGTAGRPIVVGVRDTRLAYALLSAAAVGRPADDLHLIGVTGTNGKTTTVLLIDAVFRAAGYSTGLVSTVFTRIGDELVPDAGGHRLTTPDAGALQQILHRMRERRVERGIVEVSSHALTMHRVGGCRFRGGVFTNLSRDHLDFHGGWEQYFRAKRRLLSLLDAEEGRAIINVDDRWGRRLASESNGVVVDYALHRPATVRGRIISAGSTHSVVLIDTPAGHFTVRLPLPGPCNVYNALAAAAVAWADGVPTDAIAEGLSAVPEPPGRFQQISLGQPFRVFVDFAHNPVGLLHALEAVRPPRGHRLWLVFGCKGDDADDGKRRLMGRIAARRADRVILTTDNPLRESPVRIARIVAQGIASGGFPRHHCRIILDRREAIRAALKAAAPGDVVFIAGRGHEQAQCFGEDSLPLDDAQVVTDILTGTYGRTVVPAGAGAGDATTRGVAPRPRPARD